MNAEHNSSGQQLESEESRDMTQLKKQIELTNIQLLELTHNDEKFINYIHELNEKGVHCVSNQEHKEAVLYFNQCEKILEYAASCGKTIDRSIIVVTLHNQACVNQKLWDLEKSANYLEAIIYNINFYFETTRADKKYRDQMDQLCTYIHKKNMFALYHLQFCAVNSQIRKHAISLGSAKTAIRIMKQVCHQLYLMSEKIVYDDMDLIGKARSNCAILKNLADCQQELIINDYQKYFSMVKEFMVQKQRTGNDDENDYRSVRNFSIGKLMQLTPITIDQIHSKQTPKDLLQTDNIITLALYLGVSFFTVGTQLRFISSQNSDQGNEVYKLSQDFLISEVYHIYSIMLVLKYVPVRSIFLNHLLTSFNSHYEIDLEKVFASAPLLQVKSKKKEGQVFSYASSQQLHLAASTLPQESALKNDANKVEPQLPALTPPRIDKMVALQKPKTKASNIGLEHNNSYHIQGVNKISRTKSPRSKEKSRSKSKKEDLKIKSRQKIKEQNLKLDTQINIVRKIQTSKQEQSMKSRSKTKSDFHKSTSSKKKNIDSKFCIYTTKIKKDLETETRQKTEIPKKSKSKSNQKSKKQNKMSNRAIPLDLKRKSLSKEVQKCPRNLIGKIEKKMSPSRKSIREHDEKQKHRPEKIKMNKVQSGRH